jgi:hypothetical protein
MILFSGYRLIFSEILNLSKTYQYLYVYSSLCGKTLITYAKLRIKTLKDCVELSFYTSFKHSSLFVLFIYT